ncbi:MAG: peptidoglycan DD-metalloendopeptidase family protein [Rhodospirillales bacterium]
MRRLRISNYALSVFTALALCLPSSSSAQNKNSSLDTQIKEVEKAIAAGREKSQRLKRQADSLKSDLSKASNERVAIAKSVQNLEQRLFKLEAEIDDLNQAETEKRKLLESRRGQFANVLMALQRISRLPPEAVIAYPAGAADLIRTAILLRSAVPQIEGQAARLREDLIALAATRELIAKRKSQLDIASLDLRGKRAILDGLIRIKAAIRERTLSERREATQRIAALTGQAKNLRDLFENFEQELKKKLTEKKKKKQKQQLDGQKAKNSSPSSTPRKIVRLAPPTNLKSFALSRGTLRYPAIGPIKGRYGEPLRRGVTRKGLTIETRSSAQVVAPHDGKVVFAGNFRGYGQLLIIDHGEGYHSLLAGMSRIDGIIGQYLLSGEPVGVMGSPKDGKPSLYIELRRNSQPINPAPWLVQKKNT